MRAFMYETAIFLCINVAYNLVHNYNANTLNKGGISVYKIAENPAIEFAGAQSD